MVTSALRRRSSSTPLHPQAPHGGGGGNCVVVGPASCDDSVDSATTCTGIFVSSNDHPLGKPSSSSSSERKEHHQQQLLVVSSSSERSTAATSRSSQAQHFCPSESMSQRRPRSNSFPSTPSSSSSRIRTKYLQRLGVTPTGTTPASPKKITPLPQSVVIRKERSSSFEILKTDNGLEDSSLSVDSNPTSPISSTSSSVRFQPCVEVQTVPARHHYSNRIRDLLWMPPLEMSEMVHRNSIEFASENWDWRSAAEEDDFVFCGGEGGGEKIHPAHIMSRRCNLQRQFCMVMSANFKCNRTTTQCHR